MTTNVGIDVAKHSLEWAAGPEEKIRHCRNDVRSIKALARRLTEMKPRRVVVESTGGYERRLVETLAESGLPVILLNPWRVRRFGEGMGILAKTDPIDARVLALYAERARPPIRPIAQGNARILADLVARRRQLIRMVIAEKARLEKAPRLVQREIQGLISILDKRVASLDRRIDARLAEDPDREELSGLLQTVPGVGPQVTRTLLIDLPELGSLDRREVASLVGVAPFANDSGKKRGHRKIRGGRASVRTALYLAAMCGARFNPVLRDLYQRLRTAGKPAKLAFIAVARKLLTILNAMARERTAWEA